MKSFWKELANFREMLVRCRPLHEALLHDLMLESLGCANVD